MVDFNKRFGLGLCGLLTGILLILLFIFMLAMPWYYHTFDVEVFRQDLTVAVPAEDDCRIRYFIGWDRLHCSFSDEECPRIFDNTFLNRICPDSSINWRDVNELGFDANNTRNAFNVAVALVSVAFFFVIVMTVAYALSMVGILKTTPLALIIAICGIIALIFLLAALIAFPVMLPDGFRDDNWCALGYWNTFTLQPPWIVQADGTVTTPGPNQPVTIYAENENNPCDQFSASNIFVHVAADPAQTLRVDSNWGGAGYWIALGTWFVLLGFTLCGVAGLAIDDEDHVEREGERYRHRR